MGAEPAVRLSVPAPWAEVAGAILFDLLGPFQEMEAGDMRHLVFYPFRHGAGFVPDESILAALPEDPQLRAELGIERVLVPGGWEEGWKSHFRPLKVRRLCVRPPWEPRGKSRLDLVLSPGLAFGTGLHPTTRAMLDLLQDGSVSGPVVDCGTGSGILAIAAWLLGYFPVRAFDNDPLAVEAARANAANNRAEIEVVTAEADQAPLAWFDGATVVANMTLDPVLVLLERLGAAVCRGEAVPARLLIAGILAGEQERRVDSASAAVGFRPVVRVFESEWVAFTLAIGPGEAR